MKADETLGIMGMVVEYNDGNAYFILDKHERYEVNHDLHSRRGINNHSKTYYLAISDDDKVVQLEPLDIKEVINYITLDVWKDFIKSKTKYPIWNKNKID